MEGEEVRVPNISIGLHVHSHPARLRKTLAGLKAHCDLPYRLLLLGDGPDDETRATLDELSLIEQSSTPQPRGVAACFNRLVRHSPADFYVLLESGAQFGPRWLELLVLAMQRDPRCGLAGPSTNRSWNQQCLFASASESEEEIANLARMAAQRGDSDYRTLEPLYSLAEFCYMVRHELVEKIGEADEAYGLGPCWEMDYNIRAHRAGFLGLWVCASYVHRDPPTERHVREEADRFDASKRRYQDKFCGLRLRGLKHDFRAHCDGDSCPNFAPPKLVNLRTVGVIEPAPQSPNSDKPLVSCIMPTCDRRAFLPNALACFLAQDYPNLELLVVDDGSDLIRDLLPPDQRIRYFHIDQKQNIGAKRNFACSHARGEFIAHCDDDDWHPSSRISQQVRAMLSSGASVSGTSTNYYYDRDRKRAYRYAYRSATAGWLAALAYRRTSWERRPFDSIQIGEDVRFLARIPARERLDLRDPTLLVASIHSANTSRKITQGSYWTIEPVENILALMSGTTTSAPSLMDTKLPLVSCIMPTFNRRKFIPLALACFRSQTYPSKELVVVDDGEDAVADLLAAEPDVRYIRLPHRTSIGAKRNLACEHSAGEFIAHWDDDDWYSANRLTEQIRPMLSRGPDVTGLIASLIVQMPAATFWTISPHLHRRMFVGDIHGGTLAYRRSLWEHGIRYPDTDLAEDAAFLRQAMSARKRVFRVEARNLFVYMRHHSNAWRFRSGSFLDPKGWWPAVAPPGFSDQILHAYRDASITSTG